MMTHDVVFPKLVVIWAVIATVANVVKHVAAVAAVIE